MNTRKAKFNHSYLVDSYLGQVNREVCYNCYHDRGDKEHSQDRTGGGKVVVDKIPRSKLSYVSLVTSH